MTLERQLKQMKLNSIICDIREEERKTRRFSKIGGKPRLPKDFQWYRNSDEYENNYLSFIAQFDCAELKRHDKDHVLPEEGFLFFFYDFDAGSIGYSPTDELCAKVFYYQGKKEDLIERDIPEEINRDFVIPEIQIDLDHEKSYPMLQDYKELTQNDIDYEEFYDIHDEIDMSEHESEIQLLGYAEVMQKSMLTYLAMVTDGIDVGGYDDPKQMEPYRKHASEWVLLAQIRTIETEEYCLEIEDEGCLYFYIRKEDLAKQDFSKVWAMTQCL